MRKSHFSFCSHLSDSRPSLDSYLARSGRAPTSAIQSLSGGKRICRSRGGNDVIDQHHSIGQIGQRRELHIIPEGHFILASLQLSQYFRTRARPDGNFAGSANGSFNLVMVGLIVL